MTFLVVISISRAFKLSVATLYMFEQMLLKWWGLGNVVFFSLACYHGFVTDHDSRRALQSILEFFRSVKGISSPGLTA